MMAGLTRVYRSWACMYFIRTSWAYIIHSRPLLLDRGLFLGPDCLVQLDIQCVSVDSASLIIYPEIKATEVSFQS